MNIAVTQVKMFGRAYLTEEMVFLYNEEELRLKEGNMKQGMIKYLMVALLLLSISPLFSQEEPPTEPLPQEQTKVETEEPPVIADPKPEEPKVQAQELNVGRIYFPRKFVHANKDYPRGVYLVKLLEKEAKWYFQVSNKKGEFLFEELGIVKPYKSKRKKFRFRVRKEILRGYEYFRVRVTKPNEVISAYFLLKKKEIKEVKPKEEEKKEDDIKL